MATPLRQAVNEQQYTNGSVRIAVPWPGAQIRFGRKASKSMIHDTVISLHKLHGLTPSPVAARGLEYRNAKINGKESGSNGYRSEAATTNGAGLHGHKSIEIQDEVDYQDFLVLLDQTLCTRRTDCFKQTGSTDCCLPALESSIKVAVCASFFGSAPLQDVVTTGTVSVQHMLTQGQR